ncbi:hypothetical protein V490_01644 [Pseudogymnoascus sp. VKM F-3557]|nr:hypothetical protein V490_01644 [Pseudogymnoascus sp. VKM F-3557]
MSKEKWRPAWHREGREPAWETDPTASRVQNRFGGTKYLWGNTPALDVLKLEQNEGLGYAEDIALLFAASGDIRHVVKTIANLPDTMTQQLRVSMNDREFDVVARNVILLLLALTAQDFTNIDEAKETDSASDIAEALIHVWYSALIPSRVLSLLEDKVKPLITYVCDRTTDRPPSSVLAKTWTFSGGQSLRLVLKKKDWSQLQRFFDVPDGMTAGDAVQIRTAVTLAPERADYRDRWYYKDASPSMRIAKQRFREDGLLLPFGHPRVAFDVPNPFLGRLKETRVSFDIYNVDAKELPGLLERGTYSRIEVKVANICDSGYLGIRNTLRLLSPLLQLPQQNPHATFITTFINAVREVTKTDNPEDEGGDVKRITKYLPLQLSFPPSVNDPDMLRLWDARDSVADVDKQFERYMVLHGFRQISAELKVEVKKVNTIIDKWPTRLKLRPGEKGDKEEFLALLGSTFIGTERFVEWRRVE